MSESITSIHRKQSRMVRRAVAVAAKRKVCPKCGKTRMIAKFGFRTMHDGDGVPTRTIPQSYCISCRTGGKKH